MPAIPDYVAAVQALAAEELERLGPPCPRDHVEAACSTVQLMVEDYGDLRALIEAMKVPQ